ncbi:MAG: tetraacyldisaccharide 4'-kinase [Phycisphaerales bacterium]|nr:MAG: tetraacyldisaccharide 4'-kinase [Phycisphaerales bacterium]
MSGPLPGIMAPLTVPASWVYGVVIAARNRRYDRPGSVDAVAVPVISVGNLTAGGVGKTPSVTYLAEKLLQAGHHPVIAMRGYGPKDAGSGMSDEQAEYARRLPEVPVVADPDRREALNRFLPANPGVGCVLLDDGFQHRRLHRDLDLVLIDGTKPLSRQRLLPAGFLREPPKNLKRADAVIITHAESADEALAEEVRHYHGEPPLAWSRHEWSGLRLLTGGCETGEPVDRSWLDGKRVLTLLGIGKPQSVMDQLHKLGAEVAVNIPARDHERFDQAKLVMTRGLCEAVDAMVVTAKDWVKVQSLIDLSSWPGPIVVPTLTLDVFQGADALCDLVLQTVANRPAS